MFLLSLSRPARLRGAVGVIVLIGLAACTPADPSQPFNDPHEARNRKVHDANRALDRAVVRPVSVAYGAVIPKPVQRGVSNLSDNFAMPGIMVNNLLQGDVEHLVENTFRFAFNTTLGIGGIFDPATSIGLPGKTTDFGETLHVWGTAEGAYVELPVLGPSTERDAGGRVVDAILNPMRFILPDSPESYLPTAVNVVSKIGDRSRYSKLVDEVLYESADSYAQARILYLQNRRFELGETAVDDTFDPYEDPYGQ